MTLPDLLRQLASVEEKISVKEAENEKTRSIKTGRELDNLYKKRKDLYAELKQLKDQEEQRKKDKMKISTAREI